MSIDSRATIADASARQVAALNAQLGALEQAAARFVGRPTYNGEAFDAQRAAILAKIAKLGGTASPTAPVVHAPRAVATQAIANQSDLPLWARRQAAAMQKAGFDTAKFLATVAHTSVTAVPAREPAPADVAIVQAMIAEHEATVEVPVPTITDTVIEPVLEVVAIVADILNEKPAKKRTRKVAAMQDLVAEL